MDVGTLAVMAASWGVMMAISPALQIKRIFEQRSSEDVSIGYFVVLAIGFALWFLYGVADEDWALIVPNSVAFLVALVTIAVAARFRRASQPSSDRADDLDA